MALIDFQSLVSSLVRDDSGEISAVDRYQAIDFAVIRYSTDRPKTRIEAVTSAGGRFLDLPDNWEVDFSRIERLWRPVGEDGHDLAGAIEQLLAGPRIRLEEGLTGGTEIHVHYTIAHTLDGATDTIPAKDREAVCSWAAGLLLEQLSGLYSGSSIPTIDADSVDHQSKGRDYARRAGELRKIYLNHLGIDPKRTVPAGVVVDFDQNDSLGNDRLIHSRRYR